MNKTKNALLIIGGLFVSAQAAAMCAPWDSSCNTGYFPAYPQQWYPGGQYQAPPAYPPVQAPMQAPPQAPVQQAAPQQSAPKQSTSKRVESSPVGLAVIIAHKQFDRADLMINIGDTVTWVNLDGTAHALVAADGTGTSPALKHGQTISTTFNAPGVFDYHSSANADMKGRIVVMDPKQF